MDHLDYQILTQLRENARQSASDISKTIHLSVSTVIDRIRKLERSGLISSYTVITNDSQLRNEDFIRTIHENPNIIACYYLTGEFDFLLKICCRSSEHLEQIHNSIKDCPGVRLTRTHYVLRTVKNIFSSSPEPTEDP